MMNFSIKPLIIPNSINPLTINHQLPTTFQHYKPLSVYMIKIDFLKLNKYRFDFVLSDGTSQLTVSGRIYGSLLTRNCG